MITIRIGESKATYDQIDNEWITNQIDGRKRDGYSVCIIIEIKTKKINLNIMTPTCKRRYSNSGATLSAAEQEIYDIWIHEGLNNTDFSSGNVISFLRKISAIVKENE